MLFIFFVVILGKLASSPRNPLKLDFLLSANFGSAVSTLCTMGLGETGHKGGLGVWVL